MAIANSDGSIILSTKVDTSGINKGMSQMQGNATSLTKTFSKLGAAIASAFAIQKIIQFSNEAGQLATQTEASVQRLVDIYGSASDSVGNFIDANARALGMSKAAAASFSSVYGNLFSVWADQATNAELTNRYLNMTAVVASKTGRTVEDVQERVRSGLLGNTEAIEDLGIFVNVKTIEMTDAFQRMANGKSWEQLDAYTQQQVRSMAILEQATAKYGNEVADTSATIRNRYKAAYEDFQNSWGNIVNTVLLPVLQILTQIFDVATRGLNNLSGRSGQILENVELQEESTEKNAENIERQADAQKDLNKEMKKTLAGFDDIQILSANAANNQESSNNNFQLGAFKFDSVTEEVNTTLAVIMGSVGYALAAIGIILLCFGHIGWGIGFLIVGAGVFTVSEASLGSGEDKDIENLFNTIIAIASYGMLVLGIILCCFGIVTPLSIGLIVAGAAGLAAEVALNWNAIVDWVKGAWDAVKQFWNTYIAPVFTAKFWLDLGKTCINGLIAGFEAGVNGIIWLFESMINFVVNGLNGLIDGISSVSGFVGDLFGQNWRIPHIPNVNFGRVSIPRLAQGAVIPPNKEFLAVLGDQRQGVNIETPLSTMVEAFQMALDSRAGYGGGNTEVVLEIDGREFGRAVVEQGDRENRRIGTKLVIV